MRISWNLNSSEQILNEFLKKGQYSRAFVRTFRRISWVVMKELIVPKNNSWRHPWRHPWRNIIKSTKKKLWRIFNKKFWKKSCKNLIFWMNTWKHSCRNLWMNFWIKLWKNATGILYSRRISEEILRVNPPTSS